MAIAFRACSPESQFRLANAYIHQMKREREKRQHTEATNGEPLILHRRRLGPPKGTEDAIPQRHLQ